MSPSKSIYASNTTIALALFVCRRIEYCPRKKNTSNRKNERERGRRGMKSRRKIDEGLIWFRKALPDATLISTTTLGSREESTVRDRNSSKT